MNVTSAQTQAHAAILPVIEIGMCLKEGFGLGLRAIIESVDEMMCVLFDMRQSEPADQCEVLLQRDAGLAGEIFGGQKKATRLLLVPYLGAPGVQDGFVKTLADL